MVLLSSSHGVKKISFSLLSRQKKPFSFVRQIWKYWGCRFSAAYFLLNWHLLISLKRFCRKILGYNISLVFQMASKLPLSSPGPMPKRLLVVPGCPLAVCNNPRQLALSDTSHPPYICLRSHLTLSLEIITRCMLASPTGTLVQDPGGDFFRKLINFFVVFTLLRSELV